MRRTVPAPLVLSALLLLYGGCQIGHETGVELVEITINLETAFSGEVVMVVLNGEEIHHEAAFSNPAISMAVVIPATATADWNELHVRVEDRAVGELRFRGDGLAAVRVGFDPATEAVTLLPSDEPIFYY